LAVLLNPRLYVRASKMTGLSSGVATHSYTSKYEMAESQAVPSLEDLARLEVRLEELQFELSLTQEARMRLEQEVRRLEQRLAARGAEGAALKSRLGERERYVAAIHTSLAWRLIEAIRGLLGRRWSS
jgi:predicted  nucleic acid-binding Zn-ribbon protein